MNHVPKARVVKHLRPEKVSYWCSARMTSSKSRTSSFIRKAAVASARTQTYLRFNFTFALNGCSVNHHMMCT